MPLLNQLAAIMAGKSNSVRIIGGQLKSRRLSFATQPDLRPSKDITRETLFNWLTQQLVEANCLDLYCGTGAFAFECASRGAKHIQLIDHNHHTTAHLQQQAKQLLNDLNCGLHHH